MALTKISHDDNDKAVFGTSEDLQIFHNGSNSYIDDTGTGDLFIRGSNDLYITNPDGTETKARFATDGAVYLYHNNVVKFETTSGGATVTGDVTISDKIIHAGDTDTAIRFPSSNQISFETSGSEGLRIDGGGRLLVGPTVARTFGGSVYAKLQLEGTTAHGSNFTVTRNTNDPYAPVVSLIKTRGTSNGSQTTVQDNDNLGKIEFRGADGSDVYAIGAAIYGQVDGSPSDGTDMPGALVFGTTADGAASPTERLRIDSSGHVVMPLDNQRLKLGWAADLQIYHDGSTNIIEGLDGLISIRPKTGENGVLLRNNSSVDLFYDDVKKFETTSTGATLTGNFLPEADDTRNIGDGTTNFNSIWASTRFRGNDNVKLVLGNGQDLVIRHDGTDNLIESPTGDTLKIMMMGSSVDTADETAAKFIKDGAVELYYDNVKKFETLSNGVKVSGNEFITEGTVYLEKSGAHHHRILANDAGNDLAFQQSSDTGANSNFTTYLRIDDGGDISLPVDGKKLLIGADDDLQIYHSGDDSVISKTTAGNLLIYCEDDLYIKHGTENMLGCKDDGSVELYHNDVKMLSTENTGPHLYGIGAGSGHSDIRYQTSNGRLYYDSSTRLVKTDISDSDYGIDALKQLKPRKYKRTDIEGTPNEIGFIADEVVSVIPEIVPFGPKSFYTKNDSDTEDIPINVDYRRMTVVLTKALQEAITKIETLETKVAALEAG